MADSSFLGLSTPLLHLEKKFGGMVGKSVFVLSLSFPGLNPDLGQPTS